MFMRDLVIDDVICAKVVRCGVGVLELELVCMLAKFRRSVDTFMKGERVSTAGRLVPSKLV